MEGIVFFMSAASSSLIGWVTSTPESPWRQNPPDQSAPVPPAAESLDLVITADRDQTWEGFGGCFNELGWIALQVLPTGEQQRIFRKLFDPEDDCRFNFCRLPIGASDYAAQWYSHNEHDGDYAMTHFSIERDRGFLIPYIRAAQDVQPDLRLFASPWSPPTWMKSPKAYNYGTLVWTKENLEAYALYFAKFVQAYGEEGIRIHQVHVQNEPNSDQKFPSCLWTGEKMRDFIRDYLGPAFQRLGIDCEIWAGTIERADYNQWGHAILSDPAARRYIPGMGYQWAGKEAMQRTHESWPNLRLVQTENECGEGKNDWEHAFHVFDLFRHYITNGVNAYVYWNMILAPGGRSTWGWTQNSMICIDPETKAMTYNPEYYVMKHFSHFIRPGAHRARLTGPWTANSVAFENPDGALAVIIRNPQPSPGGVRLQWGGNTRDLQLPPQSINTLTLP
jgi:glucosylceramidase